MSLKSELLEELNIIMDVNAPEEFRNIAYQRLYLLISKQPNKELPALLLPKKES